MGIQEQRLLVQKSRHVHYVQCKRPLQNRPKIQRQPSSCGLTRRKSEHMPRVKLRKGVALTRQLTARLPFVPQGKKPCPDGERATATATENSRAKNRRSQTRQA